MRKNGKGAKNNALIIVGCKLQWYLFSAVVRVKFYPFIIKHDQKFLERKRVKLYILLFKSLIGITIFVTVFKNYTNCLKFNLGTAWNLLTFENKLLNNWDSIYCIYCNTVYYIYSLNFYFLIYTVQVNLFSKPVGYILYMYTVYVYNTYVYIRGRF